MPELPEAEHTRRVFERVAVGRVVERAHVADDPIVFDGRSRRWVRRRLEGRRVDAAHRHGKYLWLALDEGPHMIVHLGMTGTVRAPGDDPLVLSSSPESPDLAWPPRFTKLRLALEGGAEVAYTNARRLGRVLFRDAPRDEPPLSRLGFDPLNGMPSLTEMKARLARRRRAVLKSLLLDQKFAAGVGNWIADEVLYQAGLDPRRRVESLEEPDLARLHAALQGVVHVAVRADARKHRFPEDWLFHRRWGKDPDARTHDGRRVDFVQIGGRTTAWVPDVQR